MFLFFCIFTKRKYLGINISFIILFDSDPCLEYKFVIFPAELSIKSITAVRSQRD